MDFGLIAYSDASRATETLGAWRTGRLLLEVDCYSYYEIHSKKEGVPPAVYMWTITGIWRQTAPFIPKAGSHLKEMIRDPERLGFVPLNRTFAQSDDDGHAEYLLRCRLETDAPTYHPWGVGLGSIIRWPVFCQMTARRALVSRFPAYGRSTSI